MYLRTDSSRIPYRDTTRSDAPMNKRPVPQPYRRSIIAYGFKHPTPIHGTHPSHRQRHLTISCSEIRIVSEQNPLSLFCSSTTRASLAADPLFRSSPLPGSRFVCPRARIDWNPSHRCCILDKNNPESWIWRLKANWSGQRSSNMHSIHRSQYM